MKLENAMFVISIDIDVGSRKLGVINRGKNDTNIHSHLSEYAIGDIEELALPLFFETFNYFEVPATFAIRGQLTEVRDSIIDLILQSSLKHDIGAHGYYHREFTALSRNEAKNELNLISAGMKKFNVMPRSFVFPKNKVAHLDLLKNYGYKCYRGYGDFARDQMYIERQGQLYNIHPSLYLGEGTSFKFLKKIFDIAIDRKLPFHVWFHPWNFGETKKVIERTIKKVFFPLLGYAKTKERSNLVNFETMLSAAKKSLESVEQ